MKNLFYFLIALFLISCDDGDIIITGFEFDDATLQLCEGSKDNEFVFFKINTTNNEAISYNFIDENFSETIETTSDITINLDDIDKPNALTYRQFNNAISASYYCSNVPNSGIQITEELYSISGIATITNNIITQDDNDGVDAILESPDGKTEPEGDPDEDGVPNYLDDDSTDENIGNTDNKIEDGYDTDGDGIADFMDQDDDNDNILTSAELPNGDPNSDAFLNTDGDEFPNYKDNDDDGDGILTRNEDINGNGNPRDDDSDDDNIPNYLDLDDTIEVIVNSQLNNTVSTTFRTTVSFTELEFNTTTDQFEKDDNDKITFSLGFRDVTISIDNN